MKDLIPIPEQTGDLMDRAAVQGHGENPAVTMHRHLRGRYKLAITLAVLLGLPLGAICFLLVPPVYTSMGIVHIAPTIQVTMYKTDDSQPPPYFEAFVASQASMLMSRRVLDNAVADPKLREAGWPAAPEGLALLSKSMEVTSPNHRAAELIQVIVHYKNPALAQKAVNAVLAAYESVIDESSSINLSNREKDLTDRQLQLQRELESLRSQISTMSAEYHTDNVEELHMSRIAEIVKLDGLIEAIDLNLATRDNGSSRDVGPSPADAATSDLILAHEDPSFARLLDQELTIRTEMDRLTHTLGPDHRQVHAIKNSLDAVEAKIAEMRQKLLGVPHDAGDPGRPNAAAMSIDQLKATKEKYLKLKEGVSTDATKLERTRAALALLKDRVNEVKRNLDETNRTLEQLRVENRALTAGRIAIVQRGDFPVEPSTDRRIPLAIVGMLGGAGLGMGIVLLSGIIRGGYRYIDDLERTEAAVPLLGTVPDLTEADPEHESMAALSVHHLRNMLQLQFERTVGGKVYTITSSAAGDGKTSLAIALAMSFAATGRRTLIVDTDLVGRGLTRQLDLAGMPGLCEALRQNQLNGEVHATKIHSLWAMPSGVVQGFVPEHLSAAVMDRIIRQVREQFETIILDTGPILGSLEANVVAPASDGVVLVVSRGQGAKAVRASIQRLRRLGASCSGLIFNRAGTKDFDRSVSTASVSARSIRATAAAARGATTTGRTALLRAVSAQPHQDQSAPNQ
jgi:Mrp family chromosome partitioning ATPase/uncharacterized protein involved in exopolysaccharide biosynthesis